MRLEGSRSPRLFLVTAIVVIVVVDRAQEMGEDPLGHVAPLFPRLHVRKAEMDALVDAGIDHVRGRIREAVVRASLLDSRRIGCSHGKGLLVCFKVEGKHAGYGAGGVVGARGVVGIVGVVDQWLPIQVADGYRVAVVVAFLNGGEGPPKNIVEFGVPSGDPRIGHGHVDQREEPRAVTDVVHVQRSDVSLFWSSNYLMLWNHALRDIAALHVHDISDSARLFALVNLAVADAGITAWDTKFHYVFWRPLTAIQEGDNDGNPETVGDLNWQPLINNPNYPDYTSGANNATGAVTRMLALYFETDQKTFSVATTNPAAVQQTRTYDRFSDAAADVVNARIYEGIHFRFADVQARKQGRHVAQWVFSHFLRSVDDDDHDDGGDEE